MGTRRPPNTLPGTDALRQSKVVIGIFLGMTLVSLGLTVATAIGAHGGHLGHFPWPIAQWALTTPLGMLAVALGVGLVVSLPPLAVTRGRVEIDSPVDVTALPPTAWPRPLPPTRRPGGPTPGEYWLGRGRRQRIVSLLALALAVLLVGGFFAAFFAIAWYGTTTNYFDCIGAHCPPSDGLVLFPWFWISTAIALLGEYRWVRQVERRCGIWFRVLPGTTGRFTCYIRRPGVTVEAAAAALARYTQGAQGPLVRRRAYNVLLLVPFFLVLLALALLFTWLPTQWIPA